MIRFNNKKYEKVESDECFFLYNFETNKIYLFNKTSRYIMEQITIGINIEDIIKNFCKYDDYDIEIVTNDFKRALHFFYKEEFIYEE